MKNTEQEFERLTELKERLENKRDRLAQKLQEAEFHYRAVCTTIELLRGSAGEEKEPADEPPPSVTPRELLGMTQEHALMYMAQKNGGRVKITAATRLLIKAGLMKQTKNSYNMTYVVLKRSKHFQHSGDPGEYELVEDEGGNAAIRAIA